MLRALLWAKGERIISTREVSFNNYKHQNQKPMLSSSPSQRDLLVRKIHQMSYYTILKVVNICNTITELTKFSYRALFTVVLSLL